MIDLLLGVALAAVQPPPAQSVNVCTDAFRASAVSAMPKRADVDDLMHLRDIGGQADDEAPFSVSPDGAKLAVTLRQAAPSRNDYCQAIIVIDIASRKVSAPILIGGGVTFNRYDVPNLPDLTGGVIATIIPRWSPDGKWLAYLERQDGIVQVVRVLASGGLAVPITQSAVDVRSFSWSAEGTEIHFSSRPDELGSAKALIEEGRQGFRFDERWIPEARLSPFPKLSATRHFSVSLSSGAVRDYMPPPYPATNEWPLEEAVDDAGNAAQIYFQGAGLINGPKKIRAATVKGLMRECRVTSCALATRLWWRDGTHIIFSSRTGWGNNMTEISSWDLSSDQKHRLLRTPDQIAGCRPVPAGLICAIEGSKSPRRIFMIDYRTGARRLLFDPNPQWSALDLGQVRRIYWRNDRGLETFGDLVLPPGQKRASGLPLVIVGYRSRGFLRGGSGDLFPIFPLAARGSAVLVYERPEQIGYLQPVDNQAEADRRDFEGWADKKSGASSIMTAVSMLVREGIIDPKRIGLTGFSDGVDKATYTLIHNHAFKAVAMAGCCSDPVMVNASIGPYLAGRMVVAGYPAYKDRGSDRVRDYSLAANAGEIDTPILIQVADREYLRTLEVEAAFRQAGRPISLYVFPDEYHIFWQAAHRLAAYSRNLAWFEHHLLGDARGALPD